MTGDDKERVETSDSSVTEDESLGDGTETERVSEDESEKGDVSDRDNTHDQLRSELDQVMVEKKTLEDQYLRLRAEFENFRRRTRQEAEELRKSAAQDLVAALLPVIDNLERATQATEEGQGVPESFVAGIDMIYKQLLGELGKVGLEAIDACDQPFDPALHEAVLHEETEEHPDGHVIEELQKGYIFGGKVLRPSMVKVAKGS